MTITESPQSLSLDDARLQLRGLMSGETDLIANASNFTALLNAQFSNINWLGFYFLQDNELVLGPFQGLPACVRIPLGRGVCGIAMANLQTQVVPDVLAFEGHIACDVRSRSEVVVPLVTASAPFGVLDVDSPLLDRFSPDDVHYIEAMAALFMQLQFG
ncbi:MAG: GAF domain-containing protein [Halioglobus sp.]